MPELPEVEVVRRGVERHMVGRRLAHVEVVGSRVARRHLAGPADLSARLAGRDVVAVDRRGKYLWVALDGREALVVHLGMSGQLLVEDADAPRRRHQHATFSFADGGPQLRFVDQRTFGGLALQDLVDDPLGGDHPSGVPASLVHIALDPLEAAFDAAVVAKAVRRRNSAIKRVLLDQGVVSGIGNIYADEALWRSRLHGERWASTLRTATVVALLDHAASVMREALDVGGTSFDALYVDVEGDSGYFARQLKVYGRQGQPCERCARPIVREQFMNRSSHFCPGCQRRRRTTAQPSCSPG